MCVYVCVCVCVAPLPDLPITRVPLRGLHDESWNSVILPRLCAFAEMVRVCVCALARVRVYVWVCVCVCVCVRALLRA